MLLVGVEIGATVFGKLAVFAKGQHMATRGHSHSTPKYVPNRNACICSPKVMDKHIYSSAIPNSCRLETAMMTIGVEWIDKR